ncbi:hypothetical protein AAFF_G00133060 [Aldrovandia affinis]|uniref:Uncharacterized protein n=1 Tax=Aldrovandia affinis TaxID=143900 RepID=A0AAD7RQL8_9TELE|nr:hypothetical protein AAFF_G00133060 [Aldrovandia affinis]
MNLAFCVLVFLTCSSHIRGQSTSVPNISSPAHKPNEVPIATSISQATANSTPNTLFPGGPTTNSSSNDTASIPFVSTPQPTPQVSPNQTTTVSIRSSPLTKSTIAGEVTQSPGVGIHSTTDRLSSSSTLPASSTPHASVAQSSTPPPTHPPVNIPTAPATTNSPSTTSVTTAKSPHPETPSELNVGDEAEASRARLDPLLAGLVSVFIVSAAIVSLLLFLKFRKRNSGPEFRRLQDLPMDDMMEDTPLSMFSY